MDRACHLVGRHGLVTKVIEDIYTPRAEDVAAHIPQVQTQVRPGATPGNSSMISATVASLPPSLTLTLSPSELDAVRNLALPTSQRLHLSLSEAFCTEIATCLHPSVALRALSTKFFGVAVRLLLRLESHAAMTAEVPTPSFPKSALTAMLLQQNSTQNNISGASMSTPLKSNPTLSPAASTTAHSSGQSALATASIDDLVFLASDLNTLTGWIGTTFAPLAERALGVAAESDKVIFVMTIVCYSK